MAADVSIPDRDRFKPSEVCQIAGVQPYILRSWEAEFPALAVGKGKNGTRVYRRADIELVLQIKSLVFGEGLTLGAARRRLDEIRPGVTAPVEPDEDEPDEAEIEEPTRSFASDARARIDAVKSGLRAILALLNGGDRPLVAQAATEGTGGAGSATGAEPEPEPAGASTAASGGGRDRKRRSGRARKTAKRGSA